MNKICAYATYAEKQAVRVATRYAHPSPLPMGAVAPHVAEPTAAPADGNVAAVSHAQRCSCLCVNQPGDLVL